MNKFIGIGRLCADPEVHYSNNGNNTAIANFNIAIDRKYKRDGEPTADFFTCNAFGKIAEFCEKYLKKGIKVAIVGHVQNDNYTNKDGQKVYSTKILIDEIEFAESKNASGGSSEAKEPETAKDGFMTIPEADLGDLPFA